MLESGSPWSEPAALITFDDGYRDNFEVAAPILRERNVPATFFLPTAFLEAPRLPWWDQVAYAIKTDPRAVAPTRSGPGRRRTAALHRPGGDAAIRGDHDDHPRVPRRHDRRRAMVPGSALRAGRGCRGRRIPGPCLVHKLGPGASARRRGHDLDDRFARARSSQAGRTRRGFPAPGVDRVEAHPGNPARPRRSRRWPIPTAGRVRTRRGPRPSPPRPATAWPSRPSKESTARVPSTRTTSAGSASAPATRPHSFAPAPPSTPHSASLSCKSRFTPA